MRRNGPIQVVEKKINITPDNREYAKVELTIMKEIDSPHVVKYMGHYENK